MSDEDAKRSYEEHRARYITPERRQIQQIKFPNKADAEAAAARLAGGLSFTALAEERGLQPSDIDLGLIAKSTLIDPAVANAAFSLKEGEVSQPVEGRFGTFLLNVVKIEPEVVRTYEQVAPDIKREIALDRAKTEVLARHDKIEDARAAGDTLAEAAKKLGLNVRVIDAVDRSGRDPAGTPVLADLPNAQDVLQGAFSTDVGVETDPIQLANAGYVWYEVTGITRSHDRPLDEVKDKVEARWQDDQVAERLKTKAAEILDKLKTGSLAEIAAAESLKVETATELKRGKPSEGLSAGVIDAAFRAAKGATGTAQGQTPTEVFVFQVTDVTAPALDPNAEEAKKIDDTLRRSYADDVVSQYLVRLQSEIGVTINQTALRQVTGAETAPAPED